MVNFGDLLAGIVRKALHPPVADTTALGALILNDCVDGQLCVVGTGTATMNLYAYSSASNASAGATVIVPADARTTGRWLKLV